MNSQIVTPQDGAGTGQGLVQQLDSSIGEASSVMGAMVTELIRRSLRDGVFQVGQGLEAFAAEKVDAAVANWQPALEEAAARTATHTAEVTAAEVAQRELDDLSMRIDRAEVRARQEVLEEVGGQLNSLRSRARQSAGALKERLAVVEESTQDLHRFLKILEERTTWLREEVAQTRTAQEDLEGNVQELEQTRGVRGLLRGLCFWRKKESPSGKAEPPLAA